MRVAQAWWRGPGTGGTPRQPPGAVGAGCGLGWRGRAWRVHVALPVRAWEAGRGAEGGGCHATCARGPLPAGRMRFSGSCLAPRKPGSAGVRCQGNGDHLTHPPRYCYPASPEVPGWGEEEEEGSWPGRKAGCREGRGARQPPTMTVGPPRGDTEGLGHEVLMGKGRAGGSRQEQAGCGPTAPWSSPLPGPDSACSVPCPPCPQPGLNPPWGSINPDVNP